MRSAARQVPGWAVTGFLAISLAGVSTLVVALSDPYTLSTSLTVVAVAAAIVAALLGLALLQFLPGLVLAFLPSTLIFPGRGVFPFEGLLLAAALYMALDGLWRREPRLAGPPPLHLAFLGYIVTGLAPIFVVEDPVKHLGFLSYRVAGYFGLALVLRYADARLWTWFAFSVPLTGAVVGFQLLRAYVGRGFNIRNLGILRSFLSNLGWGTSNYIGAVLSLCALGSLAILLHSRRPLLRLACAASLVVISISVVLLLSRGTIIAIVLGLVALLFMGRSWRNGWVLAALGTGGVLLTRLSAFDLLWKRFTLGSQLFSYVDRVRIWRAALDRFLAHPWLGVGMGQGRSQLDWLQLTDPHNYFLSAASESGVFGLFAWIFLVAALAVCSGRLREPDGLRRSAWGKSAGVLLGVAVVHSCYEPTFAGAQYNFLFFWVFAVLYAGAAGEAGLGGGREAGDSR